MNLGDHSPAEISAAVERAKERIAAMDVGAATRPRDESVPRLPHNSRGPSRAARRRMQGVSLGGCALTLREREILAYVADGNANMEIAQALWLAESTVKSHVKHILAKLYAFDRAHAVAIGIRSGLIE